MEENCNQMSYFEKMLKIDNVHFWGKISDQGGIKKSNNPDLLLALMNEAYNQIGLTFEANFDNATDLLVDVVCENIKKPAT